MRVKKKRLNVHSRGTLLPRLHVKRRKCIEFRRMLVDACKNVMPLCMCTVAELSIKADGRHAFVHAYSSPIKLTSSRQYLEKKSAGADKRTSQQAAYQTCSLYVTMKQWNANPSAPVNPEIKQQLKPWQRVHTDSTGRGQLASSTGIFHRFCVHRNAVNSFSLKKREITSSLFTWNSL
jgi:hypothetical protein